MTIEEILSGLNEQGVPAVVMVKANSGYSVVSLTKEEYSRVVLLKTHYNSKTIKKALIKLLEVEE